MEGGTYLPSVPLTCDAQSGAYSQVLDAGGARGHGETSVTGRKAVEGRGTGHGQSAAKGSGT